MGRRGISSGFYIYSCDIVYEDEVRAFIRDYFMTARPSLPGPLRRIYWYLDMAQPGAPPWTSLAELAAKPRRFPVTLRGDTAIRFLGDFF